MKESQEKQEAMNKKISDPYSKITSFALDNKKQRNEKKKDKKENAKENPEEEKKTEKSDSEGSLVSLSDFYYESKNRNQISEKKQNQRRPKKVIRKTTNNSWNKV